MDKNISGQLKNAYMERPRLMDLIKTAVDYPLVAVYAGSGYGKTRAVNSFLQKYDAYTTWIQITERDNEPARYWENYTQMISILWPEVGARFKQIGFPDTDEAFAKYAGLRGDTLSKPDKYILVYDDLHLLSNPQVLRFFERAANTIPPNGTIILISRTVPDVNITGMMLKNRIFTISEDDLCFSADEIAAYFNQLELPATRQDIHDVYEDTKGWAFAINLIGRSLQKERKYERRALEAMKTNIYKFIESELIGLISEPLWRFLLKVSLIDHLSESLIKKLASDESLLAEMEYLNAYIRYDFHLGAYMIHHLFLDYLRQNHHMLTQEEKRKTYMQAGEWCKNNNYQADALSYYEKAEAYGEIIEIVYTFNMIVPINMAKFALSIFERFPDTVRHTYPRFASMHLKLILSLGNIEDAERYAKSYSSAYESQSESMEKNRALASIYGIWAGIRMIMCPYNDVYDFDIYFEKMRICYDKYPFEAYGPSTNQPVGSYANLVGASRAGAPDDYINALARAIPHSAHVLKGNLSGVDDLARGELCFYRRDMDDAEQFLKQALGKARVNYQYDVQNRTLLYLMLISFYWGDVKGAKSHLDAIKALTDEEDYTTRFESYDIARSHYYLVIGKPEEMPDWLKGDFSPYAHSAYFENFGNRIRAQYYYATGKYNELLVFLLSVKENQSVLYGKILFGVLESLCLYKLKRRAEAIQALTNAYNLAAPNDIIVMFTQYTKDMRILTSAALRDENCRIPKAWLEDVNRKSSAFTKKLSHMLSSLKAETSPEINITLSKLEIDILKALSLGYSRTEIAVEKNISVGTIKVAINIIFEKLYANNLAEAIHTATNLKLI